VRTGETVDILLDVTPRDGAPSHRRGGMVFSFGVALAARLARTWTERAMLREFGSVPVTPHVLVEDTALTAPGPRPGAACRCAPRV
jgi:hypothetical protein